MYRVQVKICGLSEEEHVAAAAEAGADYIGFVFAESRRRVSSERAARLRSVLDSQSSGPSVVGVFVNEPPEMVNAVAERCRLDLVQLGGDESSEYCARIEWPLMKTVKVFPGMTARDVERTIASLSRTATNPPLRFLLDTGSHAQLGGTGHTFDWRIAREISAGHPVFVAGGLDPSCVGDLIASVHPYGVDVSSGVERDGSKDTSLIRAFVQAVRRAEQEIRDAEDTAS